MLIEGAPLTGTTLAPFASVLIMYFRMMLSDSLEGRRHMASSVQKKPQNKSLRLCNYKKNQGSFNIERAQKHCQPLREDTAGGEKKPPHCYLLQKKN